MSSLQRAGAVLLLLGFIFSAIGCAPRTIENPYVYSETGRASWYGPGFHGQRTASGEEYNMYEYTAAHKRLPFGTLVRVENLENGREVVVRINDRGPYVRGRIIDLSYTAAQELGLVDSGTAKVRIEVLPISPIPTDLLVPQEQPLLTSAYYF